LYFRNEFAEQNPRLLKYAVLDVQNFQTVMFWGRTGLSTLIRTTKFSGIEAD